MTPTQQHYLVSFVAGTLIAGLTAGLDYFAAHDSLDWKPFAVAIAGGVVLFGRDWLRNNGNMALENSVVAREAAAASTSSPPPAPAPTPPVA